MKRRAWHRALSSAALMVAVGLLLSEVNERVERFGWDLRRWPFDRWLIPSLAEGAGSCRLLFMACVIPIFVGFTLAYLRHDPRDARE